MAQTNTKTVRRKRKVRLLTRNGQYYDYNLLACVVLLTCFGLIMLYSTSAYDAQVEYGSDTYFLFRQALFSVGGLAAIFVFSMIDYHFYARYAGYFYLFSNLLLLVTKFIGHEVNGAKRWIKIGPIQFQSAEPAKLKFIGHEVNGAKRWIKIGPIQFQSAEPAKLAIILFLSVLIVQFGKKLKGFKAPAVLFAFGALTFLLTWKFTENLSTAIIILGITCALIFVAHPKTAPFVLTAGIGLPVGIVGVRGYVSSLGASGNFRFNRVLAWIDPEKYSDGGGYQVLQGLYAIGSGGLFGKGLGNSTQKIQSIPEAQNDMIFSIICEELGLFGAVLLTILFVFLLYRLMFIAQNAPDLLGSLIVTGIFAHIALQVILNIAVVLNVIPTTGVTLPFISYGGTSILFLMTEMGIALNVSRQIRIKDN